MLSGNVHSRILLVLREDKIKDKAKIKSGYAPQVTIGQGIIETPKRLG